MRRIGLTLAAAGCCLSICAGVALAGGGIVNSGFEMNSFANWQPKQEGDSGRFVVYKGTPTVDSFLTVPSPRGGISGPSLRKPRRGTYAAASIQGGPGTRLLFRTLTLGEKRKLSFVFYADNDSGAYSNPDPDTLHEDSVQPIRGYPARTRGIPTGGNQQYRVDIMRPGADPYSIDDGDVLKNLLASKAGDPAKQGWKRFRFNLSSLPAGKVKLRVADADENGFLQVGFDDLRLKK
jgi:hypothetical protein